MNLGKSVSHYIKSSCHFSYFFLFAILTPFTKYETGRIENLEKVSWLKKYYNLMFTSIRIKIAVVPMNKSLVDYGFNSF